MPNIKTSLLRASVLTVLMGGLAFANPLRAAPVDEPVPTQQNAMNENLPPVSSSHERSKKTSESPEDLKQHVENRIKTLHEKLKITAEQESKWADVSQAMRDNEASMSQLIQERHQKHSHMTAVDDLQSYETITQAHADGMKKLIPVFQVLYSAMSDDQKKNADKIFSGFEGHHHDAKKQK